jgi:hypothetical protein
MHRKLAAGAAAASLLVGTATGTLLVAPSLAVAEPLVADSPTAGLPAADGSDERRPEPRTYLREALQGLVDDGTLTEAQREAVVESLVEAGPPGGVHHRRRHGPGPALRAAAEAIGIERDALRRELRAGRTIADVAAAHDVDVQAVIDAIVAEIHERLEQAVANGRLTQAEGDAREADAVERVTDLVHRERPGSRFAPGSDPEDERAPTAPS